MLVVPDVADDGLAGAGLGPQVLLAARLVALDDGVGRGEDRLGRAVVLLEKDRARVGVVLLELDDVADRGPAEGVDRLVGVTDDDELARLDGVLTPRLAIRPADELAHELVLRVVGVLVLVDEHVPEAAPVVLGHVGEGLQDVHRRHDDVVEVERVGLAQPPLVLGVDLRQGLVLVGAARLLRVLVGRDPAGVLLLVDELVLEVADPVAHGPRREALGVEVEVAHDERDEPLAVGGVVDGEAALHADLRRLAAQDAHARRVEGHDPHRLRPRPDEVLDPLAHLRGGLVGEGDREDLPRLRAAGGEQVGDAVREHPGLARARAGDDEQGAALVQDGLALGGVESRHELLGVALRGSLVCAVGGSGGPLLGHRPRRHPGIGHVRGPVTGQGIREVVEEAAHLALQRTSPR